MEAKKRCTVFCRIIPETQSKSIEFYLPCKIPNDHTPSLKNLSISEEADPGDGVFPITLQQIQR